MNTHDNPGDGAHLWYPKEKGPAIKTIVLVVAGTILVTALIWGVVTKVQERNTIIRNGTEIGRVYHEEYYSNDPVPMTTMINGTPMTTWIYRRTYHPARTVVTVEDPRGRQASYTL